MKKQARIALRRLTAVLMSGLLAFAALTVTCSVKAESAELPASFNAQAEKHIPQHLRITLHGIVRKDSYSVVTGTAVWDDDAEINECEFNPYVQVGSAYYRPKCTAWTLIKRGEATKEMEKDMPADDPYSPVYEAKDGKCSKDFELMLVEDGQEIETDEEYANGVKMGSKLRFNMTSLLKVDGTYGETPASEDVEITLTEDVFGKTFPADGASGGDAAGNGACRWCGKTHEGFFGGIQGFFHKVLYFFAHLFD